MRYRKYLNIPVVIALIVFSLFFSSLAVVFADTDYDDLIEEKESEKQDKEGELDDSKGRQYSYDQEGLSLDQKILALEGDLGSLAEEVSGGEDELEEIEVAVELKELEFLQKQEEVHGVSRSLYKLSQVNVIEILLSSDGFDDLIKRVGFLKYGASYHVGQLKKFQDELECVSDDYNSLSDDVDKLQDDLDDMQADLVELEGVKKMYEQMAREEAAKQNQLIGEITNITQEQEVLLQEKMAATQESTSVGEYEDSNQVLPTPPFSPAYAIASMGYPHRIGMSQYGAYGRSKAGQGYGAILGAYYNATLTVDYSVPDEITVDGYGTMNFEDQYMKGIAEMPTYWANSGGFEALKAQAVASRSYALAVTNDGQYPICASQSCQVYNPDKVSDPAAAQWHLAVEETRGEVLTNGGSSVAAYYASTAGGYTRLPSDFDTWRSPSNPPHLKRVVDFAGDGKAYEGPSYGNSPWYHAVWYYTSDVHPWLTEDEMKDLLNAALLPESYNQYLSHPSHGGWTHAQVVSKLDDLGIQSIGDISSVTIVNSGQGYTASINVGTSSGVITVSGIHFGQVFNLRSRGMLVLWSSLYDIIEGS